MTTVIYVVFVFMMALCVLVLVIHGLEWYETRHPIPWSGPIDEKWTDEDCFEWCCEADKIGYSPVAGPGGTASAIVRALHVVCKRVKEMEKKS